MLVKFKMIYARNLHIDFLAKFTLRPPYRAGCPIRKSTRRAFALASFLIRKFIQEICAPSFLFQPAFDPQFASLICGSRTTPLYTAARLYAFFASLRTHLRLFPARAPRLNSVASLAQSVAATSGHALRRRVCTYFLLAVVRGYFQNFT